jgi:type IV fimbrial biogenesis protein FimT
MKIIKNKGINLIELLAVISIITIIALVVTPNLSSFKKQQSLKNTTEDIVSLLNEARNSTISSKDSKAYGVHFQNDKAVFFVSPSYIDSVNNKEIIFDSSVEISTEDGINLNSGSDVIFSKITGDVQNNGTITIQVKNDSSKQKVINISPVGVIGVN